MDDAFCLACKGLRLPPIPLVRDDEGAMDSLRLAAGAQRLAGPNVGNMDLLRLVGPSIFPYV